MADRLTAQQRHRCMSRIRSRDTRPELKVRRRLFALGFRYRLAVRSLPGTPDIVLPKYRSIILVNGCFWHGHRGCRYYVLPKTNQEFWQSKIERNIERDSIVCAHLEALGWKVFTIWECELSCARIDSTIAKLAEDLQKAREDYEVLVRLRREQRTEAMRQRRQKKEHEAALQEQVSRRFHIPGSVRRLSSVGCDDTEE